MPAYVFIWESKKRMCVCMGKKEGSVCVRVRVRVRVRVCVCVWIKKG